jgi:hypothetical protein
MNKSEWLIAIGPRVTSRPAFVTCHYPQYLRMYEVPSRSRTCRADYAVSAPSCFKKAATTKAD